MHILLEFCTYKWKVHNGKMDISLRRRFVLYQPSLSISRCISRRPSCVCGILWFNLNWIDTINIITIRMEEHVGKSRGLDAPIAMPTVCWQICPLNITNVLSMKKRNRVFWWCLFVRIRVGFFSLTKWDLFLPKSRHLYCQFMKRITK